jgi:nucleotide-binding universal stress UspA family protein
MNRILFPTDFSVAANTAFVYALHFADSFNAELVILHVYDLPIVETAPLAESTKEIFDIVEMNQFESFREQLPELHQIAEQNHLGHVKMRNVLLYGDLIYTINKVCKDEMIDMIVMGNQRSQRAKGNISWFYNRIGYDKLTRACACHTYRSQIQKNKRHCFYHTV